MYLYYILNRRRRKRRRRVSLLERVLRQLAERKTRQKLARKLLKRLLLMMPKCQATQNKMELALQLPPPVLMEKKRSLTQLQLIKRKIWKEKVRIKMKQSLLLIHQVIKWTHLQLLQLVAVVLVVMLQLVCLLDWGDIVT